ncbi:MAG TPA: DEAD/DEAH box helicase [Sedimentisphaerales bacterium]|nr:DEAD/DEAH box helicase [Sedimentisphaerales bacterium]HQG47837.1 DEAD/DEAH box helicase [Sedimentisphaerales bacterium]
MPFTKFGLSDPLVQGILATGYTAPTEIQSKAIPAAISGKDIIGCAQTGTGKTAAFVLPILNRLSHEPPTDVDAPERHGKSKDNKRPIRCLILTPTRELAVQVERSIREYGRFTPLRAAAIYGGVNIKGQLTALRRGVDIVVATPGRLMDHMRQHTIDLTHVEVLVLDEADRMLDMGFILDVRKIIGALPTHRQTMLFSATISPEVKALSAGIMKEPEMIQIGVPRNPIETITQHFYPVYKTAKMDLLLHMLKNRQMTCVLVFSRTKHGADKIHRKLEKAGISSIAMHSGRSQGQRERAMDGFRRGKYQVMVATDIAARGIDIDGISHVINFDVPAYAEDYIHRIGRTGRAAATGDAITFVAPDEQENFRKIEKFIGREFEFEACEGFDWAAPAMPRPKPVEKKSLASHRPRRGGGRRRTGIRRR